MLYERFVNSTLKEELFKFGDFKPFPTASQRGEWEELSSALREEYIKKGEDYLNYGWAPVTATLYMDFVRNGDGGAYGELYFERRLALICLALAECMEGNGRFTDQIINGIWSICEESFWGTSAHNYMFKQAKQGLPDVTEQILDLFSPETGGMLAWVCYLLEAQLNEVNPQVCQRLKWEIKRRILDPFFKREDFWWMGYDKSVKVNNWNPWVNSNCLAVLLLLETDSEGRTAGVSKAMWMLDRFIDTYHEDGGCEEGTSYWAAGLLFNCLELLYMASGGRISLYDEPVIQNMGRFLYRAHIYEDYYMDFADGSARLRIPDDQAYRYGCRIGDPGLRALGVYAYRFQQSKSSKALMYKRRSTHMLDLLFSIFNQHTLEAESMEPPYVRDMWLPGIQVMAAREREGSHMGLYLAAKGGDNYESHNHNDVGNYIVYLDGRPVIVDAGVGDYTSKTFSPQRYEIWTMQSAYHNLPTVNNVQQSAGAQYKAEAVNYSTGKDFSHISMDIGSAYPKEAEILYWNRTCCLNRSDKPYVEIMDDFRLKKESDNIQLGILTPCNCSLNSTGLILHEKNGLKLAVEIDRSIFDISTERIEIQDGRMSPIWGDHLNRILLRVKIPVEQYQWKIRLKKLEEPVELL